MYKKRLQNSSYIPLSGIKISAFFILRSAAIFISFSAISFIFSLTLAFLASQAEPPKVSNVTFASSFPYRLITSIFSTGTYSLSLFAYISFRQS